MTITHASNQQRAAAAVAAAAISAYIRVKGESEAHQSPEEWLTDLLTDLRHHAGERQIDFEAAARISAYHFDEESPT